MVLPIVVFFILLCLRLSGQDISLAAVFAPIFAIAGLVFCGICCCTLCAGASTGSTEWSKEDDEEAAAGGDGEGTSAAAAAEGEIDAGIAGQSPPVVVLDGSGREGGLAEPPVIMVQHGAGSGVLSPLTPPPSGDNQGGSPVIVLGGPAQQAEVRFEVPYIQHRGSVPAVSSLASFADLQIHDGIAASMPSSTGRSAQKPQP